MSVGHYENFPVASLLLPAALRRPVEVIYRFARSADDIADEGDDPPHARLARLAVYQTQLVTIAMGAVPDDPLFGDVARIVRSHGLPVALFQDLLDAFMQDVTKKRYAGFGEVLDYCRRSANPVGRLLLHLFRETADLSLKQSDAICSALQLINFCQDVEIDYAKGRIYLPADEMARYGVTERHIATRRCDRAWRELMRFQAQRARTMLLLGAPLARTLRGRVALEIRATVQGGLRILEKLEQSGFDVFRSRPKLRWFDWPLLLVRAAV